ncbi:ribonuclease R [Limibaculum sp. M0105]|uniref:Ribonuclease R n=1 Tax=Thermohalobaculum xanthum TaxID=2753746 RepID=A0A8J7SGT9_9RHOB|nr:ribonuclease R [Thermohalobaculum xanthum]MBK0401248.1 ribonuclease R [Thermohalobaculum xanthum]
MPTLPSRQQILDWLAENPSAGGKREIARAFGIKGAARVELKRLLAEMEDEGVLERRRRRVNRKGHLPPVTVLVAGAPDSNGDVFATPKGWEGESPPILYMPRKGDPAIGEGDLFLAKLHPVEPAEGEGPAYEARLIKRLQHGPRRLLGIFREGAEAGRIVPVDKKADTEWMIPKGAEGGARDGELVEAVQEGHPRFGLPRGRVTARLGDPMAPRSISLIAMHQHGIRYDFPDEVLDETVGLKEPSMAKREDLRALPLVTIDPPDARDHDDAVAAMPDDDPKNKGGHIVWVAIADVGWYVRPGSALDREARRRGNSTYFPDRVAPMLPEMLSADLCSLHEDVDRPCIALRMVLDAEGNKIAHSFTRGMMRSRASLSYAQVQRAEEGEPDAATEPLMHDVVRPLFAAYRAAAAARERRQPLDLDLPERRIVLDDDGNVVSVDFRDRFDAHRLIEEFMILANVAAAETLEAVRRPLLYRVHEEPNPEKLESLREMVETVGLTLAKGQVLKTAHFNRLLHAAAGTPNAEMVNMGVLRSQTQAYYSPENFAHFGLNLRRYAHFTSPIRRYADLVVHRALIAGLRLGDGGQTPEEAEALAETAEHISTTERVSMEAERDTNDRYLAAFLADRKGAEFDGVISGIARFGLFAKLAESGADGLIPISTLGNEYFRHDPETQTLTGERSGTVLGLGQRVRVRLAEADPVTGGLILELLAVEGEPMARPRGGTRGRGKGTPKRRLGRDKIAKARAAKRDKRR